MSKRLLTMCLTAIMMVVGMSAYALDKKDGVYQIGTAADWEEFAALVNGGEFTANAELIADIDLGMEGTMIGVADQQGKRYDGTFDGKGHTIKINFYPEAQDAGPFRYLGWRGIIQNLKVEGAITTSSKFAAGIVGRGRGIIRNCWADVKINSSVPGDATHGGIVGVGYSGTIVENCLVQTAIVGTATQNCGGVVGWAENPVNIVNCLVLNDESDFDISNGASRNIARNDSRVKVVDVETYNQDIYANRPGGACYNNYVTNQWETTTHNPSVTVVPLADLADGKICYQLNNDQSRIDWVQRIGTDPYPVPAPFGSGRVYASAPTDCNGLADDGFTFSNSGSDQAEKHEFDMYGICSKCGMFNFHHWEFDDPTRFDQISRSVLLNSKADIDVAEGMNRVCNGFKLNMKMVNDIEYIAEPGHFIFNTNDWTEGDFDGGGHALTIELTEMGNNAALFPIRHNGSVENLIMHGKIETSGQYAGSISNDSYESAVRNVYSDIDIISTNGGDNTSGGFFGMIRTGKSIENCIYAGTITVPEANPNPRVGGISGWTHAMTTITNCAILGHIEGAGGDKADNSMNICRNPGNIATENVYVAYPLTGVQVTDQDKFIKLEDDEAIGSGELAFFLNGKQSGVERFYQKIGTDPMPLPIKKEGALVYADAASYTCDGTPVGAIYQNTPAGEPVLDPHEFDNMGICVNCGAVQEDFMTPVDGWFEISTPEQFLWWSNYASTHLDASAKLTADIDLEDYNEIDENTGRPITPRFAQVGSEYKPFYGNFDGQCHTISNLNINLLGKRGCGLISVMNSQPDDKLSERGLTADQARAEEGVYVKDVILDESCSITGGGYTGIVGMGSPWAGHINITGCMNLGDIYVVAGTNGSGMYGCSMGSAVRVTIDACGVIGDIHVENDTRTENGSFSGWLGSYAEVTNCFGLGTVEYPDPNRSFARHSAGAYDNGTVIVKNCYALEGAGIKQNDTNKKEDVSFVTKDELGTGSVTWKANGSQFRDPVWYQNIGEDDYPYPFSSHGVIIYAAEEYMAITEESLPTVASTISSYYTQKYEEAIAYQGTLDAFKDKLDVLEQSEDVLALADALDTVYVAEGVVKASAEVYKKYQQKCKDVKDYLDSHDDFAGEDRDALEYYLENDYPEIVENHELADSLIEKETTRVGEWLDLAIKNGYIAGTEVTNLFVNADFHNDFKDGWKSSMNKWATQRSAVTIQDKTYYGSEAWNTKFDMHQTVKDLKPGYYLVDVQGAFRPSNDRYVYNYAAQVYANENVNYLQAVIEDYVEKENAINGENVYISQTGGGNTTYDLAIYDDGFSTDASAGADTLGYAVHGPSGMAVAGYADRYHNYIIAKAEGDSLTIGICNPGTNYSNDWTGFSSFKVIYAGEGEEVEKYIDQALESMVARANTILEKYRDAILVERMEDEALSPCYPAELKDALLAAVAAADGAQGVEGKMKAVEDLSQLFKEFYEARQAYLTLINSAHLLEDILGGNRPLVEKDPELNEWFETGENLINEDDADTIEDIFLDLFDAYYAGSYTTEQARELKVLDIPVLKELIPVQDEDGYYQISTPKQFIGYSTIASERDATVKAKLMNDIDMTGIAMQPIGHNKSGENAVHIYRGVLDGQGHALNNVYIGEAYTNGDPATLFYELKGATVKNFKLTGEYYNTEKIKFMGGLTRWTSENSTIENCEIEVVMHSFIEGDGTHGGVVGVSGDGTVINNCVVNVTMIGEGENPTTNCGGVVGWASSSPTISNTLILSQYKNIAKGDNSNVIGRNGYTANNVFYVERSNPGFDTGGTLATEAQLASGEICWKLNGSKADDAHWFQTLGKDATPHLFSGSVVWYSDGEYVNRRPNIQLNAFASNLSSATNAEQVVIAYTLNAEAKSGAINFYAGDELKYAYVLKDGDLLEGAHEIAINNSLLGVTAGTKMTYELDITSLGVKNAKKVGDSYKVWGPYGMVINNNPASKGFGQMLMLESYPQEIDNVYISHDKPGALYAFDVNFLPINSTDGTPGFYGGLSIKGETPLAIAGTYKFDLRDLRFTADGRLFVARASGLSNSSVYEINPEDLDEPWKPVFKGGTLDEATGITYVGGQEQNRMALGLAFEGKGADLKMYVLGGQRSDGGNNVTDYNCSVYNLGTATEWTGVPSANFEALDGVYTYSSVDVGIHEDGQGGLWFIQNRNTAENPALKHFNEAGAEDYSSQVSTNSGKIAMTADGNYIAIPQGSGTIVLYENTYVLGGNGKLILTPIKTINVSETRITAMAFDYANNLYVASASTETLSRYAIPSFTDNKCVTPAPEGFVVGTESGDPDGINNVNVNGNVNNSAIYNIAGQRVSKAQKGIYIQDGKKTLVK